MPENSMQLKKKRPDLDGGALGWMLQILDSIFRLIHDLLLEVRGQFLIMAERLTEHATAPGQCPSVEV